jgi:ATP-dependent DNA helicase RecQ
LNPRQAFADETFVVPFAQRSSLGDTARETLRRFRAGESVAQIAAGRNLVVGTIYGHLATAIEAGETVDMSQLVSAEAQGEIAAAFKRTGWANLVGARESLGEKYDYGLLRVFRAAMNVKRA